MKRNIIALVGVIGSGKDTLLNEIKKGEGIDKSFDFSDAVRDITFKFLGFTPKNPTEYSLFKKTNQLLRFVVKEGFVDYSITGRKFLENIGITMRNIDPDFWANLCAKKASQHIINDKPETVIFSAVRYPNEAKAIFDLAIDNKYDVKFIMTNFKSHRYEIRDDDSERFAQELLRRGADHLDDVTYTVKQLISEYYGKIDRLPSK